MATGPQGWKTRTVSVLNVLIKCRKYIYVGFCTVGSLRLELHLDSVLEKKMGLNF